VGRQSEGEGADSGGQNGFQHFIHLQIYIG
jgi:hypothetical protein